MDDLHHGAYCALCDSIKPIREFMRTLTPAQARARGYSGMRPVEIESTMCKDCQPKPRPISKLSAGEIRQRVSQGAIDALAANLEMSRRHARAALKRKVFSAQQVQKRWQGEVRALLKGLSAEIVSTANQWRYRTKTLGESGPHVDFLEYYVALLRRVRRETLDAHFMRPRPVAETRWEQVFDFSTRMEVRRKWQALSVEDRERLRKKMPALAVYRDDNET